MKNPLLNKIIKNIKIADDKKALLFILEDSELIARCDGDCCSDTWIESVELPALGFPALVTATKDLDINKTEKLEYGEIEYYGFKISTDKGEIVIDYRNESNGYYGGSLWWPNEKDDTSYNYYYGGVHGQNKSTEKWVELNKKG